MANNKLITSDFRLHHIRQFIESITEPANTIYYVFAGKPSQYLLGDNVIDPPNTNIETTSTRVYDEMVLGKQITSNDVKPMIRRYDWNTGTVYSMYDSLDQTLENKNFFVVSPEGGNYYVFKCLDNVNGKESTSQPIFSATAANETYYETTDGYIWKYMYTIDATNWNKFATQDYVPVIKDSNVTSNAVSGAIDVVKVVNRGQNYNNYLSGSFVESDTRYDGVPLKYRISSPISSDVSQFYRGCIIKIVNGVGLGQYRKITDYVLSEGYRFIYIDTPFSTIPTDSQYEISPEVLIQGDGRNTTNAEARAIIDPYTSNSVSKIEILNRGENYFLATANVYAEPVVRTANNDCVLRVIYSPRGGHGYDVESELYATRLGISVKISNNENLTVSTDNDFRTIGVIKDPKFSDVKLQYANGTVSGPGFIDNEEIVQLSLNRLGGSVSISSDSKEVYGLRTFNNVLVDAIQQTTFSNSDIITVSNVAINAVCNVQTYTNGSIHVANLVASGYGFSDAQSPVVTSSNSSYGNVRHFNSNIVVSYTTSANGLSYSNSDYVEITSPQATINATANIVTNATGGITSLLITNSGKTFFENELIDIQIVSGGSGYNSTSTIGNNVLIITSADGNGSGATATFQNNGSGAITSISILTKGTGWTSAPTITPSLSNSSNLPYGSPTPAVLTAVIRSKNVSYKIANSIGGYSNGAKIANAYLLQNRDDVLMITTPSLDLDFTSSSYSVWESFPLVTSSPGLYANSDVVVFVSPSSTHGNAIANVITYADGSLRIVNVNAGNNFGFNLANADLDYFVANSTGGFKRYFDSRIVTSVTVANNSPHYRIRDVRPVNGGTGYNNTRVLRVDVVDGGIGYDSTANNLITFSAGSVATANAYFSNDSQGKIISVTMTEYGNGYTTAPTVTVNPIANGVGANLSVILANSITVTSTTGGHGAVIYFSNLATGAINNTFFIANAGFGYTSAPTLSLPDTFGINFAATAEITGGANNFSNADIFYVYGGVANAVGNVVVNSHLTSITDLYYTGKSLSVLAQDTVPSGIWFKPDGTRLFMTGTTGDDITQYDLSTAWDISTASFVANTAVGLLRQNAPQDLFITANGTTVYTVGGTSVTDANTVVQFSLSQAWNVQTISYVANVVTNARITSPTGIFFKNDGTRMFLVGSVQSKMTQYDLSTPWDLSTSAYVANVQAIPEYLSTAHSIHFANNGLKYFVAELARNVIAEVEMTQAWNVETRSSSSILRTVTSQEASPVGIYIEPNQGKLWMIGSTEDKIFEYSVNPAYTISLTDSGRGFEQSTLQVKIANSTGGNVRYLNGTIIKNITVTTGGYEQFISNSDIIYVTNGSINAVANAVTNSVGGLTAVNLTVSGQGFVNSSSLNMYVVNSTGGDFRYFNTTIASSIIIDDGGSGYNNTDYIVVSSVNGLNATANIVTSTNGMIESAYFTQHGKNLLASYVDNIEITYGGFGYSNSDKITFCGGDGTEANAVLLTNSSGGIKDVYIINGGINYDCAPTVEVANSIGGAVFNPLSISFNGNTTSVVQGTLDDKGYIILGVANTPLISTNTQVIYYVSAANTAIGGLANATMYRLSVANSTAVRVTDLNGSVINLSSVATSAQAGHRFERIANGASFVSSIDKPYTIRIYDANNNPSSGVFADIKPRIRKSAYLSANLMIAPTIGNTTSRASLSTAASLQVNIIDSANIQFTTLKSPNISLDLTSETTTFDSSISEGDYVFLQTNNQENDLIQVEAVTNSSHMTLNSFPIFDSNSTAISVARVKAQGNVKERGTGYVQVTNASGFFATSRNILGLSSKTTANVNATSYNEINKIPTTINQLFCYKIQSLTGQFQEDEIVWSNSLVTGNGTAYYHSGNSSNMFVTNPNRVFLPGSQVTGSTSGAVATLASSSTYKYEGDLVRGSGEIIYIENIEPISRSNNQSETIKLILEF